MSSLRTQLILVATIAVAAPLTASASPGHLNTVVTPSQPHATAATVLYINRCTGGCDIKKGGLSDARSHTSFIPEGPEGTIFRLNEFAWGDGDWEEVMLCLREVYSPYGVTVTDEVPAAGVAYNEGIVAGIDNELNLNGYGGVAPITSDCSPFSYVISFTFANGYGPGNALSICSVAAQETGHAFGLDHVFEYFDGRSACIDPMSYRGDCGGQRFFRNDAARCGEYQGGACRCGGTQNNHLKLLSVLGPGTPITTPPTVSVTSPASDAQIANGSTVLAIAAAQRGVKTVELWLNGYKWTQAAGAAFGQSGQPESAYSLVLPADVPDGVIDIIVRAKDDIDITTETAPITVTKGAPCASAESCALGQRCDAGRCFWDPPVGVLGDECEFQQFCMTELCASASTGESRCTQDCVLGVADSCPDGFDCLASSSGGVCWPAGAEETGCCSSSNEAAAQSGLLAFALAIMIRRRRRT